MERRKIMMKSTKEIWEEILPYLPEGFTIEPNMYGQTIVCYRLFKDGLGISVNIITRKYTDPRYHFTAEIYNMKGFDFHTVVEEFRLPQTVSINVSVGKSPERIAREILTRLIPKAEHYAREALRVSTMRKAERDADESLLNELADICGAKIHYDKDVGKLAFFMHNGTYFNFFVEDERVSFRVVNRVKAHVARAILEAIKNIPES
jgi:hypothetical protein